jgi:hypothetical protein
VHGVELELCFVCCNAVLITRALAALPSNVAPVTLLLFDSTASLTAESDIHNP